MNRKMSSTILSDFYRLLLVLVILISGSAEEENGGSDTISSTSDPSDPIVLPNLPLPNNPFADDNVLSLDLASETVLLAGGLAYQIFSEEDALQLLPPKYTFHSFRDTGSTEVMIFSTETTAEEAGKILVVFRGTDDTADGDWLTNIMIPKVPYGPPGKELYGTTMVETLDWFTGGIKNSTISLKVHKGFNEALFAGNMYEYIVETLETEMLLGRSDAEGGGLYYNNTVHFMGHSLGGANAQLMGTYFAHHHPDILTHITSLGAPRHGNLAFKVLAESLPNLSTWRMVFCHDVVPRVPSVKYYHAGHLMLYGCGIEDTNAVGAYYRHDGDPSQGQAGVPFSRWIVPPSAEAEMVTNHLGGAYTGWMDSAGASEEGLQSNWTSTFVSEMGEERRVRKLQTQNENTVNQGYGQMLKELKAQGSFQGLRGFPIAN